MNQINEILTFGKYKGKTVGYVFIHEPAYLLWADKNVDSYNLNDFFYYACSKAKYEEDADNDLEDYSDWDIN